MDRQSVSLIGPGHAPLPPAHYKQGFAILMAFTLWAIGYFIVKWIVDVSDARLLPEPIESRIPFVPGSVFTYLGLYPMFIFPLLWIRDEAAFSKVIRAYTALMLFCYLIFVAYPVRIERPEFAVTTFATWALSVVYRADNPPINCLPSVHVAMVFLSAFILREIRRDVGAAALLYAAAITLCTLTTKQHYIADGVVSLIVSYAVFQFVFHPDRVAKLFTRLRPIGD
ncbi:MAG: phosphatase PAP2 family protein [Deltaproteobacteria bacterium]|nr:phosphatase PAP2 family protein [Deltaproteobacteria bacterium]